MSATVKDAGRWARDYAANGWSLVHFRPGEKGPAHRGWNQRVSVVDDPKVAATIHDRNLGLAHAYSGTCCLDIDDLERASSWLIERGIDIDVLLSAPDAVQIVSGRPGRAKLLYALPEPLPSQKPSGSGLELRCGTANGLTVQDVLPPSIHPVTGKPYQWRGDWRKLPPLPVALHDLWKAISRRESRVASPPMGLEADRIRGVLARLDPDMGYDDWARVGAALHHETGGSDEGFALWDEWSAKGAKYKSTDDLAPHWRSWGNYAGRPVTMGWVMSMAGGISPDDFDDLDAVPDPEKRPRFEVWPVRSFADQLPEAWLIKGVLARDGLAMVYGESGAGKSFVVLDMCVAIAQGRDWNGRRTQQGRVVYVCAEGAAGFRKRVQAIAQEQDIDLSTLPLGVITDVPNLLTADHKAMAEQINAWGGADLIVIDTFAQATPGGAENSSEDVGKALAHCRKLAAATGALPLLVHHAGKDTTRGARGWSGIKAAVDSEVEVTRDGDARTVRVSKQKDGEEGQQWPFLLQQIQIGVDLDGDAVTSCVVQYVDRNQRGRGEPSNPTHRLVWRAVLRAVDPETGVLPLADAVRAAAAVLAFEPMKAAQEARKALVALSANRWLRLEDGEVRLDLPEDNSDLA